MPIAYCVAATSINPISTVEVSGFAIAKPGNVGNFAATDGVAGANPDKSPRILGSSIQFDTSQIPLNATVSRSKFVITANSSETSVFDSRVMEFNPTTSIGVVPPPTLDSVTEAIHQESKFMCRARDSAAAELALAGATVDFDQQVRTDIGGTSHGQVLILTSTGTGLLSTVSMWLRRSVGPVGTVFARVYSVQGVGTAYTRDELLATSFTRLATAIDSGGVATELDFTLSSPLIVSSGDIFIVEVAFSDPPDGVWQCFFGGDSNFSGQADNSLSFGTSLQGFSPGIYVSGTEHSFANNGRFISERFTFPSFVAGVQYEFGEASYSPDVTWVTLGFMIQRALDARADSNRFPLTIAGSSPRFGDPDIPTAGEERRWRSSKHATPQVVDGFSFFGPVLVIEYTVPEVPGYIVQISDPEVSVGIATASVQVAVSGPTAVATVHSAPKAVATRSAALSAEVRSATLATRVTDPGISAEVAAAIVPAPLANPTAVARVQEPIQTAAIGPATLTAQVQAATLVAEVRAATLAVRVAVSPAGGPATEDSVADLLDISPAEIDVEVTRRDSTPFSFTLQDEDGTAIDITSYTSFTLTVDPSEEPSDATANLFQITAAFPAPTSGVITFSPTILNNTQDPGDYFFDVEQIDASANVRTIIKGKYTILPDITQP